MGQELTTSRATTVLICDDNAAMRTLLRAVIELTRGMRLAGEAADGEAAIREASRLQPDVILLDLVMPVLSGVEALPRLRQSAVDAKIIVLAGFSTATVADHVLALGADSYLEKGADPATIIAAIENAAADTQVIQQERDGELPILVVEHA
jgi:DNA-binding NarL/FixJ family response regulator